jgi:hypothetical protein
MIIIVHLADIEKHRPTRKTALFLSVYMSSSALYIIISQHAYGSLREDLRYLSIVSAT